MVYEISNYDLLATSIASDIIEYYALHHMSLSHIIICMYVCTANNLSQFYALITYLINAYLVISHINSDIRNLT